MYENILCAIDASPESVTILEHANAIANQNNARLSVIHIMEYGLLPRDYQKKLKDEVLPKLNKIADKFEIPMKRRFLKFGKPHLVICDLADKKSFDLIIVGSHGKHGVSGMLGSTANGIVQRSKRDTLLVKV